MSPFLDRLAELRLHLEHLRELQPRVKDMETLRNDLSLRNDVLHSLQTVCQVVIDVASDLSARNFLRFQDDTEAVRNLSSFPEFPADVVRVLEKLPGFRNILIHEYVTIDYTRVLAALDGLGAVEEFARAASRIEAL
jgi:uncharacterized protein YutE (UPF0331/DUF86 family)